MKLKIATWNLERLDKRKDQLILDKLIDLDADIFVLTETNSSIILNHYHGISTDSLPTNFEKIAYKPGENRVSIWTKFNISTPYQTFDPYTSVCTDIETPFGLLTVYGTIIGVFANRQPRFDNDLNGQLADFENLVPGKSFCIVGDFNVTFSGRVWPSHKARQALNDCFHKLGLTNTTAKIQGSVDHIVVSNGFLDNKQVEMDTWNADKRLSDHVGCLLTIMQ